MNTARLIVRNLRHHARRHSAAAVGAVLATAVITASLLVGGSVRRSLTRTVDRRLGRVEWAVEAGARRFRADLADRVQAALGRPTAAIWMELAAVSVPEIGRRTGRVQALGVDRRFFAMAPLRPTPCRSRRPTTTYG